MALDVERAQLAALAAGGVLAAAAAAAVILRHRARAPAPELLKPEPPTSLPSSVDEAAHGLVIRAALDIGSGQHKLCVGLVNPATGSIIRILHREQRQVLLNHAFVQDATGSLNDDVLVRSFDALQAFRRRAVELGATQFAGVATAVFRRASNGEAYLQRANRDLGLGLHIVSQHTEGQLGFLAATSATARAAAHAAESARPLEASRANELSGQRRVGMRRVASWASSVNEGVVAWDSGGGSFQVSALVDGALRVWEGPVGDSNVTAMLVELQGRAFSGAVHGKRSSPNPVSLSHALALAEKLDTLLPPVPAWLADLCALPATRVVGFGECTSLCALASEVNGNATLMSHELVWQTMLRMLDCTDAQLLSRWGDLHEEEDLVLPKLLLMHTIMTRRLGVAAVHYVRTMGNCEGVLRDDDMWPR